jgi:hypothetical protein
LRAGDKVRPYNRVECKESPLPAQEGIGLSGNNIPGAGGVELAGGDRAYTPPRIQEGGDVHHLPCGPAEAIGHSAMILSHQIANKPSALRYSGDKGTSYCTLITIVSHQTTNLLVAGDASGGEAIVYRALVPPYRTANTHIACHAAGAIGVAHNAAPIASHQTANALIAGHSGVHQPNLLDDHSLTNKTEKPNIVFVSTVDE